jgi:hypothetical protein
VLFVDDRGRLAANMVCREPGYALVLSLMIARCVRGKYGAPFVIKYIVTHWATFTGDFDAFCRGLVAAAKAYSREMGSLTHLAHHDGLAAAFSGLNFLKSLLRQKCRDRLRDLAQTFAPLFTRLLRHKGRTSLSSEEYTSIGNAMMGKVCIAIHASSERFMRNYHAMDATRCFQACLQYGLGLKEFSYTEIVHSWNMDNQAKKFRDKLVKELFYFGLETAEDVAKEIGRLSASITGTIIFSTFFAHQCETRQCINRYGLAGVAFLTHLYRTVKACRTAADDVMRAMKDGTWKKKGCFAVMVLEAVAHAHNLTTQNVK